MSIITVCNHKGGTGKTTTSIHIAAALHLMGYKTMIIDLDPQAFLTRMMDIWPSDTASTSLDLFHLDSSLSDLEVLKLPPFDLLPCTGGMNHLSSKLTSATDMFWVKEALQDQSTYDTIVIDTAAAVSVYALNAMIAADTLMIPVVPEVQSVYGAEQTWSTAKEVRKKWNPSLKTAMFLLTNVDRRKKVHHQYSQYMRKTYESLVMDTVIRTCASLAAVCRDGTTVFERNLDSRGAKDYAAVVDELVRYVLPPAKAENEVR